VYTICVGPYERSPLDSGDRPNRKSIRLQHYDYSQPGAYFVTICVAHKACLFGHIVDGDACLNDIGRTVARTWAELPLNYTGVETDAFVVMPNHIHGILLLNLDHHHPTIPSRVGVGTDPYTGNAGMHPVNHPTEPTTIPGLPELIRRFKTLSTKRYRDLLAPNNRPATRAALWQRNYYEHVIRDERSLEQIRDYIIGNPAQWDLDSENPSHHSSHTP